MTAYFFVLAVGCSQLDTKDQLENPRYLRSVEGLYELEIHHEPHPPVSGPHQLGLLLSAADGLLPVADALLSVEPYMPSMDHGIADEPSVVELGEGFYQIDFAYSMPGEWELRLTIDADPGLDRVAPVYEVN